MDQWIALNRDNWDERAQPHAESPSYAVDKFLTDPDFLSDVVRFDLPRLGSIEGLKGVHLQCHIGTDTLSLHRLGARMTGLDFSGAALEQARDLAARTGADITYVQAELYDAPQVLPAGEFDLVFTGIGALGWLPDIHRWAQVVAHLLRPGGRLFIREGHPVLWSIDETRHDVLAIRYPYVERAEPDIFDEPGTYVATDHQFQHTRTASWNHGLGEIVTALLEAGMRLTMLVEHDSVPWNALEGQMDELPGGEYRLSDRPWRLPHTYTLQAVREG
ncbi:class I SAM-dependent methyltransferase [Kineosporia sp. J2-2]|uniref:Class I SAM-dependent methyltransferase n=1 Tax=Kineosporia corallincola TaxID=2835133 RepID=A0ABS5TID2_9ACTN|nr:class I SAM-dependent methyltransferase [Kineosporia corallincola]MBT0769961.1 class I SAM-dependent methyltransferase [Kineosporia corallincola]